VPAILDATGAQLLRKCLRPARLEIGEMPAGEKRTVRYWEFPKKTRRPASTKWNASACSRWLKTLLNVAGE
jgi:hypothetical protein